MAAIALINNLEKFINIEATLHFYGKHATAELGQKIVKEINDLWNEPKTELENEGEVYKVRFNIDFKILDKNTVVEQCLTNTSFRNNYIRLEEKNIAERSMMGFGLGENCGHWLISDQLGESTTAAHEFGHAMGLPHPDQLDYRNTGLPPMMAPRGTLVDSQFQWNPLAEAGTFGGTMRPIWRRVQASEVIEIINHIDLSGAEKNIGKITNNLFDEIGQRVSIIN